MRSVPVCAAVLTLALLTAIGRSQPKRDPNVAATDPRSPAEEWKLFTLPPGYEIQLVAADPDIHKPLNMAFDDRGRLWVTETVEYPFPATGRKPRDAVKILEDFGPDGRARKITTFANGLNIPIGILPLPGGRTQEALVHSIPKVWLLRDPRGTGHADQRLPLYATYGSRDTHGMTNSFTWGFDGWVYATHGFSNDSAVKGRDGQEIRMNSGNTYRMRPDGSRVEQFTRGQVNPFGLAFDPLGNLYSADCHTQPIYLLLRGASYPSFGKPHDGLGFGPQTITEYRDSTAIAGMVYYAADHFAVGDRGTAFIGDVITNKIVQFRLTWHGSSPRAAKRYFLECKDQWFRPVDVKLGPDGALYVADFYNRIIGHYEVPLTHPGRDRERGRIWRIVYRGKEGTGTPTPRHDWTKARIADLVHDLAHPNLTVRTLAANQLVTRNNKETVAAVRAVFGGTRHTGAAAAWQRAHALWVLERCGSPDDAILKAAARDDSRLVRVHAQRVLSERGRLAAAERTLVLSGLKDRDPHVRRAAADALGQHPAADNVRPLLDLRHTIPAGDTHLLHVVRMALRNQLRPAETWAKLKPGSWDERDARSIADVCLGVPSPEAAAYLMQHIRRYSQDRGQLEHFSHYVARYASAAVNRDLLAFVRGHQPTDLGLQVALFRALQRGTQERGAGLGADVRAWAVALADRLLASKNPGDVQAGLGMVGALKLKAQRAKVAAIAGARTAPEGQRKAALDALAALDAAGHAAVLGRVLGEASAPFALREHAANLLARANQPATRAALLAALPVASARLQGVIATGLAGSREGAEKLLEAVAAGKASARLLQEKAVALRLEAARLPNLKERLAKLTRGLPPADRRLHDLIEKRGRGFRAAKPNLAHGRQVFEKNCANCHQLGGKGAKVGPQLDGVGVRGLERLLEDTLDPNRNVDQAFRLTTLELNKGQVVSGLLLREEGAILILADSQGKEVRVAKKEVAERKVSQMSPMPANFDEQLPEADFYDLLGYLLKQTAGPDKPGKR